jgi:heptosyltransferase II
MAGKTDLRQLISMISECDLLVTNDSGPMHIGYAVRTPVVAIFGSTSPEHTGPAGRQDVVIRKPVDCAPCFRRECRKKSLDCMDMIFPDEVFHAMSQRVNLKRAVFFDRDGTLCKDPGYLRKMEDLVIFPGVDLVRRLKDLGFLLIGVTNQSGIARGLVDEDFVKLVNGIFIDKYGFDGFYFCPHHPDEHCSCRKPEPGLLQEARVDYNIDLKSSYVIGDRDLDMVLAKAVGATGILVKTGQEKISANADHTAGDIREAVDLILSKEGK